MTDTSTYPGLPAQRTKDERVGPYILEAELGRGTMGVVYQASHHLTKQRVAVKILFENVAAVAGAFERFQREVQIASMVEAPGVVKVFDAGEVGNTYYYAMELLGGESFDAEFDDLSLVERLEVIVEMLESLHACHEAGIVHRDIKPENVHIEQDDEGERIVRLIDFGIAQIKHGPRATQSGVTLGTPAYMSPEQALGDQNVNFRSDIWAVGVLLYECVTGELPYEKETPVTTMMAIVNDDYPHLIPEPGVPIGLIDVIERCLLKAPEERWADALALRDALGHVLSTWDDAETEEIDVAAAAPATATVEGEETLDALSPDAPAIDAGDGLESPSVPTASERRDSRRLLGIAAAACLAIAAILAGIGLSLQRSSEEPAATAAVERVTFKPLQPAREAGQNPPVAQATVANADQVETTLTTAQAAIPGDVPDERAATPKLEAQQNEAPGAQVPATDRSASQRGSSAPEAPADESGVGAKSKPDQQPSVGSVPVEGLELAPAERSDESDPGTPSEEEEAGDVEADEVADGPDVAITAADSDGAGADDPQAAGSKSKSSAEPRERNATKPAPEPDAEKPAEPKEKPGFFSF